jgi:transposase
VADGGALAKAIDYSLRRWPAFARYATNGFYPIDNNPVENAIRPIAIGKNYPRSTIRQGLRVAA